MLRQILHRSEIETLLEWDQRKPMGFDVETNAIDPWLPGARIVGLSLAGTDIKTGRKTGTMIPLAHKNGINADPDVLPEILSFLTNLKIIPFYVQMEATQAFAHWKIKPAFIGDGYIAARILQLREAGLKDLTEKVLQRRVITLEQVLGKGKFDFSEADPQSDLVIDYQIADAVNGLDVEEQLRGKLVSQGMLAVYQLEVMTAVRLAYESFQGYACDIDHLDKELKLEEAAVKELQKEIFKLLNCEPFSINSPQQLGKMLRSLGLVTPLKTDKGAESWSSDALEMLVTDCVAKGQMDKREMLLKIMEWKSRFSQQNSLKKRPADVAVDGRMHPTWKPIGFDGTSRMYSEGPSMTSLTKPARRAFKAPPGKRWIKFDWRQAEVRILAHLSKDEHLKAVFSSGKDYHKATYSAMSGILYDDVTEENREVSKILTYSVLYSGGNAWHVATKLGITQPAAAGKVGIYFSLYPRLRDFLNSTRAHAQTTRHCKTVLNRMRKLEGNDLEKIGDQACNAMGQQSCGTYLKIALNKLYANLELGIPPMKGFCQVVPVFDAIFYCIDADVPVDDHIRFAKQVVELELEPGLVLEADFEVGNSWGEMVKTTPGMAQAAADFQPTI